MSQYQKGKTNLDFTEARDSEWQRHQLGHMQVCTSLQTNNHASTPPLSFLQAGCPSCRPTNSVKALKALLECFSRTECPKPIRGLQNIKGTMITLFWVMITDLIAFFGWSLYEIMQDFCIFINSVYFWMYVYG